MRKLQMKAVSVLEGQEIDTKVVEIEQSHEKRLLLFVCRTDDMSGEALARFKAILQQQVAKVQPNAQVLLINLGTEDNFEVYEERADKVGVALEVVHGDHGILAFNGVDPETLRHAEPDTAHPRRKYVQVVDDRVVAEFNNDEIAIAPLGVLP